MEKQDSFFRRSLAAVGIVLPPNRPWRVHLNPRFFGALASLAAVLLLFLAALAKYSESPSFCNSCHIMDPYYKAWKTSKHNFVACVECHYPPGSPRTLAWKKFQALSQVAKYVTRTYSSKPFAEIDDSSCLRSGCHSARLLQGKVVSEKGIKFDHRPHLTETRRGRQLRCVSCHSQIVVGKHVEVTYDTCYLCHFKGMGEGRQFKPLGGCLGCHDLPEKSFKLGNMTYNHKDFVTKQGVSCRNCHLDVVQGEGKAPEERCFTCHNQPEKLAKYGDIPFLHENHVTKHNVACFHCHQEMRHGFAVEEGKKMAVPPHPPTLAFDCAFCHQNKHAGQLEMYSGKVAGIGLPEIPSPMYLAQVDCIGCHYQEKVDGEKEFKGITFKASDQACVKCHGPKFSGIWQEARAELEAGLSQMNEKAEAAWEALEKSALSAKEKSRLQKKMGQAQRRLRFIHAGRGEHNIYLASVALREADSLLDAAGEELKAGLADLSSLPLISGGFCATMCHAKVGVKVPPEKVKAFGKLMPHKAHSEMMGCVQCHEIGEHKKVPLKKGIKDHCRTCHPD